MRLSCVTISGADNATPVEELVRISNEFTFVEWGILLSQRPDARPRFPDAAWRSKMASFHDKGVRLSAHICGKWARQICIGRFPAEIDPAPYGRCQLNIADCLDDIRDPFASGAALPKGWEFIVQVGQERGLEIARRLKETGTDVSVLLDASRGHGIAQDVWPNPPVGLRFGFAGGLGPENLKQQLEKMSAIVGDRTIWVDMESRVRTDDAVMLDLGKIRCCLEIARAWSGRDERTTKPAPADTIGNTDGGKSICSSE